MILNKLWLHRSSFNNEIKGNAEFVGENGKIEINLNEEQSRRILIAVGDALIETATETANMLKIEVIESVTQALEDKNT
jgi:hypothetical protein